MPKPKQFSSDTRVVLATCFPVFREVVLAYIKTKNGNLIFEQEQLDQIRLSPHHHFLWEDIRAVGADAINIKRQIPRLRIRFLQRENIIKNTIEQVNEKKQAAPKETAEIEKKLSIQYQRTQDSLHTLNVLLESDIHKISGELDNLMMQHDQQWRNHRSEFTEKLIQALEKNGLIYDQEKERLLKQETIPEILKNYEVTRYPLPIEKEKITNDSGNYFLLQACLTATQTSFQNMQTVAPEQIYAKVKEALKDFFREEKTASGKLIGDEEKSRKSLIKEKDHVAETLKQLWAQDLSQYEAVKEILGLITSTVGVNIKLKEEEQRALERALDEEFDYELEIREGGLRYG